MVISRLKITQQETYKYITINILYMSKVIHFKLAEKSAVCKP